MSEHRYVITGPPGSGKTPVLRQLAAAGFAVVAEPAREVIAQQRAVDGDGVYDRNPQLFWSLMLSRAVADYRRAASSEAPVFFDRGIPDLIGYARLFGLDPSEASQASDECRYNDIVFEFPSWPEIYTTDDERRMTFEEAHSFGRLIRSAYVERGYTLIAVPKDAIDRRTRFIVEALGKGASRP